MKIAVQKFGGSSVAHPDKLRHVAGRVVEAHRQGYATVAVVSAMGDTTDELLDLARSLSSDPDLRELDMLLSSGERISMSLLALAVQERGVDAISLTGAQSGIRTSGDHFNADIEAVRPARVRRELAAGKVVVVAGFQGASPSGETTTLGRGGSDTSAVALAAALGAERCEIFSDVDGVFTADPRIVDDARLLERIDYDEMLELARHGASVLHPEAVKRSRDRGLALRAAPTFGDATGTLITAARPESGHDLRVRGVAGHRRLARLSLPAQGGRRAEVLEAAGRPDVFFERRSEQDGRRDIFVRAEDDAHREALVKSVEREFGSAVRVQADIGSVSAVGWGIGRAGGPRGHFQELSRRFGAADRCLASEHSITQVLADHLVEAAMRTMHGAFVPTEPASGRLSA
jgi:aspartate kinase